MEFVNQAAQEDNVDAPEDEADAKDSEDEDGFEDKFLDEVIQSQVHSPTSTTNILSDVPIVDVDSHLATARNESRPPVVPPAPKRQQRGHRRTDESQSDVRMQAANRIMKNREV
jgi:hypothetical protein